MKNAANLEMYEFSPESISRHMEQNKMTNKSICNKSDQNPNIREKTFQALEEEIVKKIMLELFKLSCRRTFTNTS